MDSIKSNWMKLSEVLGFQMQQSCQLPVSGQKPRNGLPILSSFQHRFPVDLAYLCPQPLLLSRGQEQWKLYTVEECWSQIHRDSMKSRRPPVESCREFIHSNYFLLSWTGELLGSHSSEGDWGLECGPWELSGGYSRTLSETRGCLAAEPLSTCENQPRSADPAFTGCLLSR